MLGGKKPLPLSYILFNRLHVVIICSRLTYLQIVFPQVLMGQPYGSIPRKTVPRHEQSTALNLDVVWDIEVSNF